MTALILLGALALAHAAEPPAAKRRADVERVAAAGPTTACWGQFTNGSTACASYKATLVADASFPPEHVGAATVVTVWCGDSLDWAARIMAEAGPRAVWKRFVVYQKCALYPTEDGRDDHFAVRFHHFIMSAGEFTEKRVKVRPSGPNATLSAADVRGLISAMAGPLVSNETRAALKALDVRVVTMLEPGRGYPYNPKTGSSIYYSTDEVGAYLHYVSEFYDDLLDGTFFCHGHLHGGPRVLQQTMNLMARTGVAPQTYFGTTPANADRHGAMPKFLNLKNTTAKRAGNYRNAEFFASRLAIRRRTRDFFQTALGFVGQTARCADHYMGIPKPQLDPPFEHFADRDFECPPQQHYSGGGAIEGYWNVLFCEPCVTPKRGDDKRIDVNGIRRALRLQDDDAGQGRKHVGLLRGSKPHY